MFVEPLPSLHQTWAGKTAKNKIKKSLFICVCRQFSVFNFFLSPIESCITGISSYKNKMIRSININDYKTSIKTTFLTLH